MVIAGPVRNASSRDDRVEVGRLAAAIQEATEESVELAYVDQDYTGEKPAKTVRAQGIALEVVRSPEAKCGFVQLPRRWILSSNLSQRLHAPAAS